MKKAVLLQKRGRETEASEIRHSAEPVPTNEDVYQSGIYGSIVKIHNGGNLMRTRITLACTECKNRNYDTTKDKKTHPDRIETKKYCRFCRTHTLHKETK